MLKKKIKFELIFNSKFQNCDQIQPYLNNEILILYFLKMHNFIFKL